MEAVMWMDLLTIAILIAMFRAQAEAGSRLQTVKVQADRKN
jgi:hypothetical protein